MMQCRLLMMLFMVARCRRSSEDVFTCSLKILAEQVYKGFYHKKIDQPFRTPKFSISSI